jgi:hypothetical protein
LPSGAVNDVRPLALTASRSFSGRPALLFAMIFPKVSVLRIRFRSPPPRAAAIRFAVAQFRRISSVCSPSSGDT